MNKNKLKEKKVLVILGPTASGKTSLGVRLADKYQGEIISADSRQVYRGMDIGTAKDLKEYRIGRKKIPYHLIDVVSPKTEFNLAKYQKLAFKAIEKVLEENKLPIIVGGTGLYLQALVDNYSLSNIKPDLKKRQALESLGKEELFKRLEKMKPDFAHRLNNSDRHNPRRLVRYLEILATEKNIGDKKESPYKFLVLGLDWPDEVLRERIVKRINDRLDNQDMVEEVECLHSEGVSWKRLISFGLEYKFITYYLTKKLNYQDMVTKLSDASYRFAKKQKTWFKRWQKQGREIVWIENMNEAEKKIDKFLRN
jgi:tRNA dimethylallyltransferase